MTRIAFLGLGAMGSRMATRLLDAGHPLTVWNRSLARAAELVALGAMAAPDPLAAVAGADIAISMVGDDDAARDVWSGPAGALGAAGSGARIVECSTITPGRAAELAAQCAERGLGFLEAPVVGTRPHAEKGLLTVLAGGPDELVQELTPVLEAFAGSVHHVGPAGSGARATLAVNTLFAAQVGLLAELLPGLASTVGMERAVGILNALPTASPAASRAAELMAAGHRAPNFPMELVAKDLRYAGAMVDEAGVDARIVPAVQHLFSTAVERGHGGDDIVGVARLFTPQ